MMLLSLESSATPASCALTRDGVLLGEFFIHTKLTHSETLMPMVQALLGAAKLSAADIDAYAVSAGPGSFTGVRIGVAAVKGLAAPKNAPCVAVSSLEAAAMAYCGADALLWVCMDARCNQFYNAAFLWQNGQLTRLCPDRAELLGDLDTSLAELQSTYPTLPIFALGDGAALYCSKTAVTDLWLPPEHIRYQRAYGVAMAAQKALAAGKTVPPAELLPVYLRLPQAERELLKKQKGE